MSLPVSSFKRKNFHAAVPTRGQDFQLPSSALRKKVLARRKRPKLRGDGFFDGLRSIAQTVWRPSPSPPQPARPSNQELFDQERFESWKRVKRMQNRMEEKNDEELLLELEVEMTMQADEDLADHGEEDNDHHDFENQVLKRVYQRERQERVYDGMAKRLLYGT